AGNTFIDTQVSGLTGVSSLNFDYSVSNLQPANNTFIGLEPATNGDTWMVNTGMPDATAGHNYVYNLITTDGAVYETLANVVTDGGQMQGSRIQDDALAGNVGEYVESTITTGSPVSLMNNTPANVTNISLTAGDWDVWFSASFTPGGNVTVLEASVSQTS